MKKIYFLLTFIILSLSALCQSEKIFDNLETKSVMTRLFEGIVFNSNDEGSWKPNFSEAMNMPVSDDKYCHTALDTIVYYPAERSSSALLIFNTSEYQQGKKVWCHTCAPMLSVAMFDKVGDKWEIKQFKKDFMYCGFYAENQSVFSIEKFSDNFYSLKVHSQPNGGQGYLSGYTTFYSLDPINIFSEIFSYCNYDTNEGAVDGNKGYTKKTDIKIKKAKPYYNIELTTKTNKSKLITKKVFKYSAEMQKFLPSNN